ncbi:ATP-dependent translocase ABCB1-like isoform X2 [Ischnura elegans]|uniref:ATP-dependent translocase ABCB1-like isoform X2 n=1 Tax=Ischnura elegans TaxID=197161 RepID=UPI001ED8B560|nr:ATP-dependent translocase ABCB1-like isoform X2 [Ischnura elegans]
MDSKAAKREETAACLSQEMTSISLGGGDASQADGDAEKDADATSALLDSKRAIQVTAKGRPSDNEKKKSPTKSSPPISPGKRKRRGDDSEALNKSGILGLFRCARPKDLLLMAIGLFFAIIHGASFPVLALVFGRMTNTFILQTVWGFKDQNSSTVENSEYFTTESVFMTSTISSIIEEEMTDPFTTITSETIDNHLNASGGVNITNSGSPLSAEEFMAYMTTFSLYYLFIGIGVLIASYIQTYCWELASERQVNHLRRLFFAQVLRQDIGWFDKNQSGDLSAKLSDDLERIREGLGCKFSMVLQFVSTFIAGIIVGLIANWRLTLVIMGISPLLIGTSAYLAKMASSSAAREQLKYGIAGGIAEEVLSCIRTVASFGGQNREIRRYEDALETGRILVMRKYYLMACGVAVVYYITYGAYGLAFWYGSGLIGEGVSTPGSVFTVFFSVMAGAFSLGNALPFVNAVSTAIGAASTIFGIIDRVPSIDPYSKEGMKPSEVDGRISFRGVNFFYPTRPEVQVLKNFNLDIEPGKKVALVGSSGGGKSTIVGLLMRFYDPSSGKICLDGIDVRSLNLHWLRSQIGVVPQEPVLFGATIAENIRYGRENVTIEELHKAAELANAHSFITALPLGYDTLVGDRGAQLSGGQKQRIAIARALVRDPKVLLLDEATSALDTQSEGVVQQALEKAMYGRTTIVVAHRLSTVRDADVIYAMKNGVVVESGSHQELMALSGLYYSLVMTQAAIEEEENQMSDNAVEDLNEKSFNRQESYDAEKGISSPSERKRNSTNRSSLSIAGSLHGDPELDKLQEEVEKAKSVDVSVWRLFKLNSPEWPSLALGLFGCAICGSIMPVFAYFYGEIFSTFTLTGEALKQAALFWTGMFMVLAFLSGTGFAIQLIFMCLAAEKLIMRLRLLAFINILRQPVGWFDMETYSAGKLITRLARDAPFVKAAAGLRAGTVISSMVTLICALSIAFIYGWKLAMLLMVGVPLIAIASYHQTMVLRRNQRRDADLMEDAGRVASECIQNVKTVQALGKEDVFNKLYMDKLKTPYREAKKQTYIYAMVYAFSQGVIFMMYAAAFRFGAYLIEIEEMEPTDVYRVFFALAFCAASVGQSSAYLQDYTKAKLASGLMFQLVDQKSNIDPSACTGVKPSIQGCIELQNVYFSYPNRSEVSVLRGLNFSVNPGRTLALVGASGCGKSTVISLLQRFYDPKHGVVLVDGFDIKTMNVAHLRASMGVVTQEPVLFDCSIRENIEYGICGLTSSKISVSDEDIVRAARTANIHDFIASLPEGYDTMVGERGTQLSGGQKQRIAIARALIRNPKILLLDEATSALDTESEKVVQEALDKASKGRTCVVIAHRLSTIMNADSIAVIHKGRVVEQGTHEELKALRGFYYHLITAQRL